MTQAEHQKVLVVGGAGQAGSIHVGNLLSLGVKVGCFDIAENKNCEQNFDARTTTYKEALAEGYSKIIIALPDNMLYNHTKQILDSQSPETPIQAILIEKPGSLKSKELNELVQLAKTAEIPFFIDYQRSFDPRLSNLAKDLASKVEQGYDLEYVSVYSCDKAQPPQAAHQAINQGCHDYAMLLFVLDTLGFEVSDVSARGVKWGILNDTRFLKITGEAEKRLNGIVNENAIKTSLFDVQMGRVSSKGTFTEMYIKMSKYDKEVDMYQPFENTLKFPEKFDPNSAWSDTWSESFTESVRQFANYDAPSVKGTNGHSETGSQSKLVDAAFGVRVLAFAERALDSLK